MSVTYKPVLWNWQKIMYDIVLLVSVGLYIFLFTTISTQIDPGIDPRVDTRSVDIRAYGSAAFILLHLILSIGPLSRLNPRFLPLLYNRRHMGVTMFFLALIHLVGVELTIPRNILQGFEITLQRFPWEFDTVLGWYHDFGNLDPLISALVSNTNFFSYFSFPFESLGFVALAILFVMAATSHDFWLNNLTAPVWKGLHMLVYLAYGLLVAHVVLGALQSHRHPFVTIAVGVGFIWIVAIHLLAGFKEFQKDAQETTTADAAFVDVGSVDEIVNNRAKVVCLSGERVAVFKYEGKISALSNVCKHQNGPLGEGKIIDGCVTCPWHGYQYLPESGSSPPPFAETVPTFEVKLQGDRILLNPTPKRPGTPVEPALIGQHPSGQGATA